MGEQSEEAKHERAQFLSEHWLSFDVCHCLPSPLDNRIPFSLFLQFFQGEKHCNYFEMSTQKYKTRLPIFFIAELKDVSQENTSCSFPGLGFDASKLETR